MKYILNRKVVGAVCLLVAVVALAWGGIVTHQRLAQLEKLLATEWTVTDKLYKRRLDLVSQVIKEAKATPNFDGNITAALMQAQTDVEKVPLDPAQPPADPGQLAKFDQAQDTLTKSLFRVTVMPLVHHDLKVSADFRNLASQAMNVQTDIGVARNRFNTTADAYDQSIHRFPGILYAAAFGFHSRPFFAPQPSGGDAVASSESNK